MSGVVDKLGITDSVSYVLKSGDEAVTEKPISKKRGDRRRQIVEKVNARGSVTAILRGPDGKIKQVVEGYNLITDHGDEHSARRLFDDAIDIVTGMRLGTDAGTAASKAGAGGAIVAYITGSFELLDAVATHSDKGTNLGYRATYVCTWIAGDVTNATINEVVLSDETPLTDVAGALADTVARFIFPSTIDKQAGDSLEVTWNEDILGA